MQKERGRKKIKELKKVVNREYSFQTVTNVHECLSHV